MGLATAFGSLVSVFICIGAFLWFKKTKRLVAVQNG